MTEKPRVSKAGGESNDPREEKNNIGDLKSLAGEGANDKATSNGTRKACGGSKNAPRSKGGKNGHETSHKKKSS